MVVNEKGERVQEWLELPNGCICCSVRFLACTALHNLRINTPQYLACYFTNVERDDFVLTVERLIQRKEGLDYIFIETSGLADPAPIAQAFWVDDQLESCIYLDSIVSHRYFYFLSPSIVFCC